MTEQESKDVEARMSELRIEIALGRAKYNTYRTEMVSELLAEKLRADDAERSRDQKAKELQSVLDEMTPYIHSEKGHICKGRLRSFSSAICSSHIGGRSIIRILVPKECEGEYSTWKGGVDRLATALVEARNEQSRTTTELRVTTVAYSILESRIKETMQTRIDAIRDLDAPSVMAVAESNLLAELLAEVENISKHTMQVVVA